jgi:hypothetical protein
LQHLGNLKLQESMRDNNFLLTVSRKLGNNKLTAVLQSEAFIEPLQKIGNNELKLSLEKVNTFDPKLFQDRLKELSGQLPPLSKSGN